MPGYNGLHNIEVSMMLFRDIVEEGKQLRMEFNVMDKILGARNLRSKGYKAIAEYITENTKQAAFMTAGAIAKEIGVSESTVVRFASALGYTGYPEFHKALGEWVQAQMDSTDAHVQMTAKTSESELIQKVLTSDMEKINDTIALANVASFELAVDMILSAKQIYVMGLRNSEPVAHFLSFYLQMIRGNVTLLTTSSTTEFFEQMIRIGKDDVFIGIGFPRYSMRTLKAMEFANDRKAGVIAITDNEHSPMKMYSTCNLFAATDSSTFIDSMVAPMSLINALLTAICIKKPKEIQKHLKMLEQTWNTYQVYLNDEIDFIGDDPIIRQDEDMSNG